MFRNKKGDLPSLFYAIVAIFVAGIVVVVLAKMFYSMYDKLDVYMEGDASLNDTVPDKAIDKIKVYEYSIWDYVILAIAISYLLFMAILAYSTRVNIVFYIIYAILSGVGLLIAVLASNTWQQMASTPSMADTITNRFPISNILLGSYFPTFVAVIILITIVLLFGKWGGGE